MLQDVSIGPLDARLDLHEQSERGCILKLFLLKALQDADRRVVDLIIGGWRDGLAGLVGGFRLEVLVLGTCLFLSVLRFFLSVFQSANFFFCYQLILCKITLFFLDLLLVLLALLNEEQIFFL